MTKRSKTVATLHAKFKTDAHPLIGKYLDDLFERAKSKENSFDRSQALKELEKYKAIKLTAPI